MLLFDGKLSLRNHMKKAAEKTSKKEATTDELRYVDPTVRSSSLIKFRQYTTWKSFR